MRVEYDYEAKPKILLIRCPDIRVHLETFGYGTLTNKPKTATVKRYNQDSREAKPVSIEIKLTRPRK